MWNTCRMQSNHSPCYIFSNHKIIFTNEGFGSLPPATIHVQIGEEEFELAESFHLVPPDKVCDIFLENITTFSYFLKKQKPNIDVKVVFLFKKFEHSYVLGVFAKSVGHWLEQIPPPSFMELVQPYEIPIEKLDDKGFERLCEWIVAEYPEKRFKDVRRLNEDGGADRGRDVLATEAATGKKYVFQCKRVHKFGSGHIEKELNTFAQYIASDPSIKPDVYVLFMSAALNDKIEAKGNELAKKIGMEIEYWHRSTIDRLVTTNQIVKERFWKIVAS